MHNKGSSSDLTMKVYLLCLMISLLVYYKGKVKLDKGGGGGASIIIIGRLAENHDDRID